jgi:hypothetical protein
VLKFNDDYCTHVYMLRLKNSIVLSMVCARAAAAAALGKILALRF